MNEIQKLFFRNVNEFMDYLPPEELKIVEQLREIIIQCIPDVKEKLSYHVPFYYRHSRICFIWPAAIPWGGIQTGVMLGFCKGHLLSDTDYLETGQRKSVYTKTFHHIKEIDREKITQLLFDAVVVDEEGKKSKRSRR